MALGAHGWLRRLLGTEASASTPERPRSAADDHNDFTFALYGHLRQQPGNLFFSPLSIRAALTMTCAGARGETAAQMRAALRISSSEDMQHAAFVSTFSRRSAADGGDCEMAVANSLWGQDGALLLPDFVDLIARRYGGTMNVVDFGDAETARATINQWVDDETRQKIQQLVPSGGLSADTRLVLVNAVYFKAMWVLPFREAATRDELFHLEEGGTAEAPLMHQEEEVWYMKGRDYQAVELFYRGGTMSMIIWLPDRKNGLRDLETMSLASVVLDGEAKMEKRKVSLFLPRCRINWGTADLREQLTALGMPLAFNPSQADFSGINGHEPPHPESLSIASVFHQAKIEVSEKGTEAAAATAVTMQRLGAAPSRPLPVPIVRADHPFLFAIRDRNTGAILFLGRVANPAAVA